MATFLPELNLTTDPTAGFPVDVVVVTAGLVTMVTVGDDGVFVTKDKQAPGNLLTLFTA